MLDQLDLVHMNGRVYDPLTARFVSADPLLQDPMNGQSYNRYAYVLNNPTNLTDPTGFEHEPVCKLTMCGGGDWKQVGSSLTHGEIALIERTNGSPGNSAAATGNNKPEASKSETAKNGGATKSGETGTWRKPGPNDIPGQGADGAIWEPTRGPYVERTLLEKGWEATKDFVGEALYRAQGIPGEALVIGSLSKLGRTTTVLEEALQYNPCKCFVAGTPVQTKDGPKSIEKIKVGDLVAARDETTGETAWKPVLNLIRNGEKDFVLVSYKDDGGERESLGVTPEHPFMLEGNHWVRAGELHQGDRIMRLNGGLLTVEKVIKRSVRHHTYNFEVAEFHTYFVGKKGAWVHNACDYITKAINLPGWRTIAVDMVHVAERHMEGGARVLDKSVFVGLNERGVMAAIRQAYGSATTVATQGERVLLEGVSKTGISVQMWLNRTTKMIETAYPVAR